MKTRTVVVKSRTVAVKSRAVVVKSRAVVVKTRAVVVKSRAVAVKSRAVVVKIRAVAVKTRTVAVKIRIVAVKIKAGAVKTRTVAVKIKTVVVKSRGAGFRKRGHWRENRMLEVKRGLQRGRKGRSGGGNPPRGGETNNRRSGDGRAHDGRPGAGTLRAMVPHSEERMAGVEVLQHHFSGIGKDCLVEPVHFYRRIRLVNVDLVVESTWQRAGATQRLALLTGILDGEILRCCQR